MFKNILILLTALGLVQCTTPPTAQKQKEVSVLCFNILQGGHNASNIGFYPKDFGGSRFDDLARIIKELNPDIVGIQEDTHTDSLIMALGKGWNRCHNIYSKFNMIPVKSSGNMVHSCKIYLPDGDSIFFMNTHWWPQGGGSTMIQSRMRQGNMSTDMKAFAREVENATKVGERGERGYNATINIIKPHLDANERVILVGDYNECSHLDWTERYAKEGKDRWIKNPTNIPLNMAIEWPGSKLLEEIGLSDAYRVAHPNEVTHPGDTWTPPYPDGTPGRRNYSDQVLERIDRIYFNDTQFECKDASLITGNIGDGDIKLNCKWPSDHWAVFSVFKLKNK